MIDGRAPALAAALLLAASSGCAPPPYRAVDAQLDLQVDPDADPFELLGAVRVCADDGAGWSDFWIYPRDPGSYLVPDLPDATLQVVVLGFDLTPDEIRDGGEPTVVASARVEALTLAAGGESAYAIAPFTSCTADCPADCAAPPSPHLGEATLGLRRVEVAEGG